MELTDKVIVVTGAASGIGRGLAQRFAAEGARAVVAVDFDAAGATAVAEQIAADAFPASPWGPRPMSVSTTPGHTQLTFTPWSP